MGTQVQVGLCWAYEGTGIAAVLSTTDIDEQAAPGAETSNSCFLAMLFPFAVHTGEPLTGKLSLLCPLLHPCRNERTGTARQKAAKAKYT